MKELVMGLLSKTLNLDADKLAEILFKKSDDGEITDELNEDALKEVLRLDAERVSKIKPEPANTKEIFDNGHKKAEKEVSEKWESDLRKQFGVDAEGKLKGDALITAIKTAVADQGNKMEPDKVKLSKEYLDLEASMQEALKTQKAEYEGKLNEIEATHKKQQSWASVEKVIREEFKSLNPILPADAHKANNQIEAFLQLFKDYDYQPDEESGFLPMLEGKRVEDEHKHAVKLAALVKAKAEQRFDFNAQPPAGNAGNQNGGTKAVTIKFKNENEYLGKYNEATTPEAKAALYEAWTAQQAS
jgi:hypothetical protein